MTKWRNDKVDGREILISTLINLCFPSSLVIHAQNNLKPVHIKIEYYILQQQETTTFRRKVTE